MVSTTDGSGLTDSTDPPDPRGTYPLDVVNHLEYARLRAQDLDNEIQELRTILGNRLKRRKELARLFGV
jgi:hypothetical protein